MPGGNRMGPAGMGPKTGRAAGYCAGYPMPGFANPIAGRGYGFGFGRGMGYGFRGGRGGRWGMPHSAWYGGYGMPYAAPSYAAPSQELGVETLKEQAEYFKNALDEIQQRITELETKEPKK